MTQRLPYRVPIYMALSLWMGAVFAQAQETGATPSPAVPQDTEPAGAADTTLAPVISTAVPGDERLEAAGARIGDIQIKVVDVFDPENPKESGGLYRVANKLHINTREATVRPQLLFRSGDVYSRHLLDETERNLRARRYLDEANITPTAYHPDTNTVDLLVRVHDVWTLNPGGTFGHSGGVSRTGFQLDESNLLGLGKTVSVDYIDDVDRSAWKFGYRDPNLFSSRWELAAQYHDTSDGDLQSLTITHPFYSLDTRWTANFDGLIDRRVNQVFENGIAVDQYRVEQKSATIQGGWSTGLRRSGTGPAWVGRALLGWGMSELTYAPDPVLGTRMLPENRSLNYPLLGLTWFQDLYEVTRNRDKIGLTEDLYVGRLFNLSVGYAAESMGADRNTWVVGFEFKDVFHFTQRQLGFANLTVQGRREQQQWLGTLLKAGLRYDLREGPYSLLTVLLDHQHLINPDIGQQVFLGSEERMRGYPFRYRSGTQNSVLSVEQRFYTEKQILRLLSVGGAAFVDVGHISGGAMDVPGERNTFADIGFGLRLGNIRSSRGDIFHLDVAYPLNAEGDDRKVQFSVETKTTF